MTFDLVWSLRVGLLGALAVCAIAGCNEPCPAGSERVNDGCRLIDDSVMEVLDSGPLMLDSGIAMDAAMEIDADTLPAPDAGSNPEPVPDPFCGDGKVDRDRGEVCDGVSDTCDIDCTRAVCGDGLVNQLAGETCEGLSASCDEDCTEAVCGDSTINALAGEACDDGNATTDDACVSCKAARCGDGYVWQGREECDGNGAGEGGATELCNSDCSRARCGDGIRHAARGETCDDGNQVSGDGCSSTCRLETLPAQIMFTNSSCTHSVDQFWSNRGTVETRLTVRPTSPFQAGEPASATVKTEVFIRRQNLYRPNIHRLGWLNVNHGHVVQTITGGIFTDARTFPLTNTPVSVRNDTAYVVHTAEVPLRFRPAVGAGSVTLGIEIIHLNMNVDLDDSYPPFGSIHTNCYPARGITFPVVE